jgi:predicted transcriptional regulator/CheY-like chemotaxis protein
MARNQINSLLKGTPSVRDLLVFLYELSPLDLSLLSILLKLRTLVPLEKIAAEAARDKSTVFRSLQRMVVHRICVKEERNLKEGGYYHVYGVNDIRAIKETARERIETLRYNIDNILKRFEIELNEIASPANIRVLVAEDESAQRVIYKVALESKGHRVTLTENGEDCIRIYKDAISQSSGLTDQALPFDVVILDYRMPKRDGIDVAKEILSLSPKQRIIFASAYLKDTILDSLSNLGQVVEVLHKPFDVDVLTSTIEDRAGKSKLERMMHAIEPVKNSLSEGQVAELFRLMTEKAKSQA